MLTRTVLIAKCAEATGFMPAKVDEVFDHLVDAIGRGMKAGRVTVDDFGTFGMFHLASSPTAPNARPRRFRAAAALIGKLNALADGPSATLVAEVAVDGAEAASPIQPEAPALLLVHPVRTEDAELIEGWLRSRIDPSAATDAFQMMTDTRRRLLLGTAQSIATARRSMLAFARRCPVPLLRVGLAEADENLGVPARAQELSAYAADYVARARPRLERYRHSEVARSLNLTAVAIRTHGWVTFVRCARDFLWWLEDRGYRPKGSNPLATVKIHSPIDYSRGKVMVVTKWCRALLRWPSMTARERAILYLLAQGLRASEVAGMRIEHVDLREGAIRVVGKRNKTRTSFLQVEAIQAIDAHLQKRRSSLSPWLFPSPGGHIEYGSVYKIFGGVVDRAFPSENEKHIRRSLSPHKLRHHFITAATAGGMKIFEVMAQTGIADIATVQRYVTVQPTDLKRAVQKVRRRIF